MLSFVRKSVLFVVSAGVFALAGCGSGYPAPVAPVITVSPASVTALAGATATFSVVATGTPVPTYQWTKGQVAIQGATSSSYTTPVTAVTDSGSVFTVTVANSAGSVTSSPVTLTVNAAPAITTQPVSATVLVGATATFSVVATGAPAPTYQWFKGGVLIAGATSASYTTPATAATDTGSVFTVVATNVVGSVTSSAATLTVNVAPKFTTQPVNATALVGATATFSAVATGNPVPTYQWFKGGVAISGATGASFTTPVLAAGDNGNSYTVVATNVVGSATSSAAALTVNAAPVITTQPVSATVVAGATATFSVVATGLPAPTYQWLKGGVAISGATSTSYTTPATVAGDNGGSYTVTVTNSVGSVTSSAAVLTVNVAPAITTQPVNASVLVGATATFSVVTTGNPAPTYQWYKSGVAISGATGASYTTPVLAAGDNGNSYTVVATNVVGSATSSAATLTVSSLPVITSQPQNATAYIGDTATFMVVATGLPSPTYQWSKGGVAISGATTSTYVTPILAATDTGSSYTVAVTNSVGSVTSNAATLTVNVKPASIVTQPANTSVSDGGTATFTVVAAGTTPISYQWKKSGVAISGATSATYSYAAPYSDNGSQFTVTVSNSAATVTSNAATLTVSVPLPTITTQPSAAMTMFVGETASFSVVATGGSTLTYQWKKNAANISGATSASYTTPALVAGDNNATFSVTVTNSSGSVASNTVTLSVGPFATTYTSQQGNVLSMWAWPGTKNAFLTKTASYSGPVMRKVITAADGAWNYYAGATGTLPSYYFTYNGLATIADTGVGGVNLCGDGCTFIGATGMELSDNATGWLYNNFANNVGADQQMFFEFGRSFWLFPGQLQYQSPADSSCEITGYATLMRYKSIAALGYTGTYQGSATTYASLYSNTLGMIDTYAANSSLNFNNTFLVNTFASPYGGCSDLWASMVIRLSNTYGGETFTQALFKQALLRPTATTTQTAIDNFVLAASAAAGKNLTLTFGTTWKWPVSTAASQEAQSRWGNPQ